MFAGRYNNRGKIAFHLRMTSDWRIYKDDNEYNIDKSIISMETLIKNIRISRSKKCLVKKLWRGCVRYLKCWNWTENNWNDLEIPVGNCCCSKCMAWSSRDFAVEKYIFECYIIRTHKMSVLHNLWYIFFIYLSYLCKFRDRFNQDLGETNKKMFFVIVETALYV